MLLTKRPTKQIFSWCLFDWANSGFPTVITAFVFATYFMHSVVGDVDRGTSYWAWSLGGSGIIVALISPFLGAIADRLHTKKVWLAFFTLICIVSTALLWFTEPSTRDISWAITCFVVANIGFECTQVFYNSMLIDVAPVEKMGRISGWGWSTGYIGGLFCLFIALAFIKGGWISTENALDIRATLLLVAGWFLIFSLPLFILAPKGTTTNHLPWNQAIKEGGRELIHTFQNIKNYRQIFYFFIARLIYMDGLNTLLAFAGVFAAGSFGFTLEQILIFAILSNASAGIGAFSMAWLDDLWGSKKTILISLTLIFILGVMLLFFKAPLWFWILGLTISLFVGPAQAASRSYLARLAPKGMENEFFGIYSLSGRLTAFVVPILFGVFTTLFSSQRGGMGIIFVFIGVGAILLSFLPEAKARVDKETTED